MARTLKRPIHNYTVTALSTALSAIRDGMGLNAASRIYGVPRGTLQDCLKGRVREGPRKMGRDPYLTRTEEEKLVEWCTRLAKCGFPRKEEDLLNTVQNIIKDDKRQTPFKNDRPGRKWYSSFLRRNPQLTHRTPEGLSKGRATITEEYIQKWFRELKCYLAETNNLDILDDPSRILNGDETSFSMCPKTGKVIAPKGFKNVYTINKGNEKETITVLLVFSAMGKIVPPMVVFPYKRPPKDVINSMRPNWFLGISQSGWMRSETFYDYIVNGVHNWVEAEQIKKPVLLFVDGHKSHLTMQISQFCYNNEIILYALPPNTTHIMQPADVSVFKPLKTEWKKTVREWQGLSENVNYLVTKATFCPILERVLDNISLGDAIKNGFKRCGLYPFDPNAVDYSKCVQNSLENLNKGKNAPINDNLQNDPVSNEAIAITLDVITKMGPSLLRKGFDVDKLTAAISSENNTEEITDISSAKNTEEPEELEIGLAGYNEEYSAGLLIDIDSIIVAEGLYTLNPDGTLSQEIDPTYYCDVQSPKANDTIDHTFTDFAENSTTSSNLRELGIEPDKISSSAYKSKSVLNSSSNSRRSSLSYSPRMDKHLKIPKPLPKSKNSTGVIRPPSAISSMRWRQIIEEKEDEKLRKTNEVEKRKEQRARKREAILFRRNPRKNLKNIQKLKQICGKCNEDLISDIEDDDLKNIGCDDCPRWYHLKCTTFSGISYNEVATREFKCDLC